MPQAKAANRCLRHHCKIPDTAPLDEPCLVGPILSSLCGNLSAPGYNNGPLAAAAFSLPRGMALAAADGSAFFVADSGNGRIRRVSLTGGGSVIDAAGSGDTTGGRRDGAALSAAALSGSHGLSRSMTGDLYFSDSTNNCIRVLRTTGMVNTVCACICSEQQLMGLFCVVVIRGNVVWINVVLFTLVLCRSPAVQHPLPASLMALHWHMPSSPLPKT